MSFLRIAYINTGKKKTKRQLKAEAEADQRAFAERIMEHQGELFAKALEKNRKIRMLQVEFHDSPKKKNGFAEYHVKLYLTKRLDSLLPRIANERSGWFHVQWYGEKKRLITTKGFSADLGARINSKLNKAD